MDLEGFRGVKRCKKPIDLSKFTLLIGANNAGKSALLEALFLLPVCSRAYTLPILGDNRQTVISWLHGSLDSLVYRYSGYGHVKCLLDPFLFNLTVGTSGYADMKVGVTGKLHRSSDFSKVQMLSVKERKKLIETLPYPDNVAKVLLGTAVEGLSRDEMINRLSGHTAFIPRSDKFMDNLKRSLYSNWNLVEKTGAHSKVVRNVIAKVVEDRLTEVTLKKDDIVVRKEFEGDSAYIRVDDMGDGVKRFLLSALYLEALSPKIVLWDDIETAAHPSLISAMIRWLDEHNWQVIASTHSIDVLREFVTLGPTDGKVLSLRKSADDVLTHKDLSIDKLEKLFEVGQDVRKLMEWR